MTIDEIRTVTIRVLTEGMDKATADINKLAQSQGGLAVASDTTSKSTGAVQNAMERAQRTLDSSYAANLRYNQTQLAITRGHNEGLIPLDRYNQLSALNTQRLKDATNAHSVLEKAMGGVQGQLVAMAAGAGPIGVFFAGLGPWGIAAAVGLTLVEKSFEAVAGAAGRMGEFSRELQQSAQTMGINTDQLQALDIAAASVGVNSDKNTLAFERFTVQLNELRRGTGTLFTELISVDGGLTRQLASTKNVSDAIDLLAASYARATDQITKNAIARAAFGRQGFAEGRVLTAIDAAGGVDAYKAGLNSTDLLTQEQIKHWGLLSVEIEHATTLAKNNLASIFTTPVLEAEKRWAETFLEVSRAAKSFSTSGDLKDLISPSSWLGKKMGLPERAPEAAPATFEQRWGGMPTGPATTKPAFDLEEMKRWTSFMGSALTVQEQFTEKQLALKASFEKLAPAVQASAEMIARYTRAEDALKSDAFLAQSNAQISILGSAATQTELLANKRTVLADATRKAGVSSEYAKRGEDAYLFSQQQANEGVRESLGIASQDEIARSKLIAMSRQEADWLRLTTEQRTTAVAIIEKEARATAEAAQVRASSLPGLRQAQLDAANLGKQLDQLATSEIDGLASGFSNMAFSTDKFSVSLTNMGINALKIFDQMIMKMILMQTFGPIFQAGGAGLMGLFGGSSGVLTGGAPIGAGGIGHAHTGGVIGVDSLASKYVHPAYFEGAPRFHSGGIAGDEVPIIARKGEGVFTPGQMAAMGGAGGTKVEVNVINNAGGTQVEQKQRNEGGVNITDIIISKIDGHMARGGFDGSMATRYGARPVGRLM